MFGQIAPGGEIRPQELPREGVMRKIMGSSLLGITALAGTIFAGCNMAPNLDQEGARQLIQAHYASLAPVPIVIMVNRTGLKQGIDAKYWKLTKVYPNNSWADYTLTPEGKQVLALQAGGDVIQWRPDQNGFAHFFVATAVATHPRVVNVEPVEDDVIPNVPKAKSTWFVEAADFTGVPMPLQDIAHNPGNTNTFSTRRQVEFALEGGVWKVHEIR